VLANDTQGNPKDPMLLTYSMLTQTIGKNQNHCLGNDFFKKHMMILTAMIFNVKNNTALIMEIYPMRGDVPILPASQNITVK